MTPHPVALELVRLIRDALRHEDGNLKCCACGGPPSIQWIMARASNISMAIVGNYDVRPLAVSGEISDEPPPVRPTKGDDNA